MERFHLEDFKGGWIVGNFAPSIEMTETFEFGVKSFLAGDREPAHFQKVAQELTVVISGRVRLGGQEFVAGEICLIPPNEVADFEAVENGVLAVIKFPSDPMDKELA